MSILKRDMFSSVYARSAMTHARFVIDDPKSVEIAKGEQFDSQELRDSRLRQYFIAMRSRYFDEWTENMMSKHPNAVILQFGCGLDSRCERVANNAIMWYDIDQPHNIQIRRQYFAETDRYKMIEVEPFSFEWIASLMPSNECIIVMEGIGKYCSCTELSRLFRTLQEMYKKLYILMDFVTDKGANFINNSYNIELSDDRLASHYYRDSRDHMLAPHFAKINYSMISPVTGIDSIAEVLRNTILDFIKEHRVAKRRWVKKIPFKDRLIFWYCFGRKRLRKYYRVYELETLYNSKY